MFPSYDMNPIAVEQMQRERLVADFDRLARTRGLRIPVGGAVAVIILAIVALI